MNSTIKVEVWSDIMCPYCYVGKKFFEKALAQFEHADKVELHRKAFQLNLQLPDKGKGYSVIDYLQKTLGIPQENMLAMFENLKDLSQQAGIKFNLFNAIAANTRDAHRLIKFAETKGVGGNVFTALYNAFFEEAKDYSDYKVLIEIGANAGISREEVVKMLESDAYNAEVEQDINEASQLGINTIPTFLFNRKISVVGSQPVEAFSNALKRAYNFTQNSDYKKENQEKGRGPTCSIDGVCEE